LLRGAVHQSSPASFEPYEPQDSFMEQPPSSARPTPAAASSTLSPRARRWGSVVAVVVLAGIVALAWYLTHRPPASAPGSSAAAGEAGARGGRGAGGFASGTRGAPPSTVGVAAARQADIPVIIDALGTVTPVAVATVTPQVSGVITQVLYQEGQMVKKGDVLATIDPQPFQAALDQAIAARQRDAAQLDAARVQLERYKVLLEQDSIARQTVDTQDALVKQLTGTVALDRANETTSRLNLQWSRIVAPIAGRVGLRPVDAGNYIAAGNATGVATITQISPIDVQFSIPQERVPDIRERIAAGATLPVTAWDSGRTRKLDDGTFLTLDNQIDVQTGTVKAKARFANATGALFPNQFVNVRLLLRTISAAVVVPVIALRHGPNGDFVYVVNADHTVSLRNVAAGISGVNDVAITTGLALGEQVVTEGGDRLKDGARIQTSAERAAPADGASPGGRRGNRAPGTAAAPRAPGATQGADTDGKTAPAAGRDAAAAPARSNRAASPRTSPATP
jgi:multidrug efflux system membrane fusion protein